MYIDINSYFATIEQQLNPDLRNKPIAIVPVISDSTCAIAASYEAKLRGIKTGTKIYEAKQLCPELICIKARHKIYVEYHHKIFQEIDKYLQVDHIFSIDEGACRLTGKYCNEVEGVLIAQKLKKAIKENVGDYINCSIGIAPNRYLAKIASNMQKIDGLTVINPSDLPGALYKLKLRDLPGVGAKTLDRLVKNSILSVEELCHQDKKSLCAKWGSVNGEKTWSLIRGVDLPVEKTKNSTIGHSEVLAPHLMIASNARNCLLSLVLRAGNRLRARGLYTNSILLTIDVKQNVSFKSRIKVALSCDDESLTTAIMNSWDNIISKNNIHKIKKISVSLHNLQEQSSQLSFDMFSTKKKQEKLSQIIDNINNKLGENLVRQGLLSKQNKPEEVVAFGYVPKYASDIKKTNTSQN